MYVCKMWLALVACRTFAAAAAAAGDAPCEAASRPQPPRVIELYTSEGCDSCPPVDRWLSTFMGRDDVIALAYHVDYFDQLGWKDRFSSAAHTRRQEEQLAVNGGKFKYTPQVVIDGRDRKDFARAVLSPAAPAAPVELKLVRKGEVVTAQIRSLSPQALSLAAHWAATLNGLVSEVSAGENAGATLHHDFVVRDYRKVAPWVLQPGQTTSLEFEPARRGATGPRDVSLVVSDMAGVPVQAVRVAGTCL